MTTTSDSALGEDVVTVQAGAVNLAGRLLLPDNALGLVLLLDEAAAGGQNAGQRQLANVLATAGIGSLLVDLLTPEEEADAHTARYLRNDVQRLASRVVSATDWLAAAPERTDLPMGYFGGGIRGAVALAAAAVRPSIIAAIVLSSGRPLLVRPALPQVRAPTLLITDTRHEALVKLNRAALWQLLCEKRLQILSHTGEESEQMEVVARLASDWFDHHFRAARATEGTIST